MSHLFNLILNKRAKVGLKNQISIWKMFKLGVIHRRHPDFMGRSKILDKSLLRMEKTKQMFE